MVMVIVTVIDLLRFLLVQLLAQKLLKLMTSMKMANLVIDSVFVLLEYLKSKTMMTVMTP
jgi:hypothetical protein